MKRRTSILFLTLLLALCGLVSCAKKPQTKQGFVLKLASLLAPGQSPSGGVFIRGVSDSGSVLLKLDSSLSAEFLPGVWSFQVVSYEGPNPYTGSAYCGGVSGVVIGGASADVDIDLTTANCLVDPYASLRAIIDSKFKYPNGMNITSIIPAFGAYTGGTNITIKGVGFYDGLNVMVGAAFCLNVKLVDNNTLTCTTNYQPSGAPNVSDVTVTNFDSRSVTKTSAFQFVPAPSTTSLSPTAGALTGLNTVTITGSDFKAGASVSFGSKACTLPVVVNSTTITCSTPSVSTAGPASVVVTNPDGQKSSSTTLFYTYNPAPSISATAPSYAFMVGGNTIAVSGTGFLSGAVVRLGGLPCTTSTFVSSTLINCVTPARSTAGAVALTVTNPDGQVATAASTISYSPAPTITVVNPTSLFAVGGNTVNITGTNFMTGATVKIGGVNCPNVVVSTTKTSITCTSPALSVASYSLVVTNADNQSVTYLTTIPVYPKPTITSISTNQIDLAGGVALTVVGTNFSSSTKVFFGTTACPIVTTATTNSSTSLTCRAPAMAKGSYNVVVENADTQQAVLSPGVTYADLVAPNVSAVTFTDGDYDWSTTQSPKLTWTAATDPNGEGLDYYEVALGRSVGATDVLNWTNVGNVLSYKANSLNLARGTTYYARVRAVDKAGNTSTAVNADGWVVRSELCAVNSSVNTVVKNGNTLYLGGNFSKVGEWIGGGIGLDKTNKTPVWNGASVKGRVVGKVTASVGDGNGGFFIAGIFTSVAGVPRNNLAHILPDGSVDPNWNPSPTGGAVNALAFDGSWLYVGGNYTSIAGVNRTGLAAISPTSGLATNWNPPIVGTVKTMLFNAGNLFIGGTFSSVYGVARGNLAEIDIPNNTVTLFDPSPNAAVNALALDGTKLYFGGSFTTVGGISQIGAASFDLATGGVTAWQPFGAGTVVVNTIAVNSGTVYLGGVFNSLGVSPYNVARNNVGAIDATTGIPTSWDPNADGAVYSILLSGSEVYLGGVFANIGGTSQPYVAVVDATSAAKGTWNPKLDNNVKTLSLSGANFYVGGDFSLQNSRNVTKLAACDMRSGLALAWAPFVNGEVKTMTVANSKVYVGGAFDNPRSAGVAAFDLVTGSLDNWTPQLSGAIGTTDGVYSLAYYTNGTGFTGLIVGGDFFVGTGATPSRSMLAGIDLSTGNSTNLIPSSATTTPLIVRTMSLSGSILYVAGDFNFVGTNQRNGLAAFDLSTNSVTSWNPGVTGIVNSILPTPSSVLIAGKFSAVNGSTARDNIAEVNLTNGLVTTWSSSNLTNNIVNTVTTVVGSTETHTINSVVLYNSKIYAGGITNIISPTGATSYRSYFAIYDLVSNSINTWNPMLAESSEVNVISVDGSSLYVGGKLKNIGGGPNSLAPVDSTTGLWLPGH